MKFYAARTIYPGADKSTTRYFSTEDKAQGWLNQQENGEVIPTYDQRVWIIPAEGCSWDDIKYWNNF